MNSTAGQSSTVPRWARSLLPAAMLADGEPPHQGGATWAVLQYLLCTMATRWTGLGACCTLWGSIRLQTGALLFS